MSDSLVIIPTLNERENIEKMVRQVMGLKFPFELLVVDDHSPDGTAEIVEGLKMEFPERLHLERRRGRPGLGPAYLHGFEWALARQYRYIFEMDADFSHRPEDLERLRDACGAGADVAIGSRYVKGGGIKDWSLDRTLLSTFASWYVRTILWIPIHDTTAGFKCYRRVVLESLDFPAIAFTGYAFQIEMKYAACRLGFKLAEVPIVFVDRVAGASKMSLKIFKEAFLGVLQLRFKNPAVYRRAKPGLSGR